MTETKEVTAFFDRLAPKWDDDMIRDDAVIGEILDNAAVFEGKTVLDVACGTGVLIPDYLARGVSRVTAIDISPRMIEITRTKYCDERVHIVCGDAQTYRFGETFDCIVVYNAFPHFADPERLIGMLAEQLRPGGTLTVAHGMSRERIIEHHRNVPASVSDELMPAEALAELMNRSLTVTKVISDGRMYQVCAIRTE